MFKLTTIFAVFSMLLHLIQSQRPQLLNASQSLNYAAPSIAPFVIPTIRPRSDIALMIYKPSPPPDINSTRMPPLNSRTGKFSELKHQIRRNGTVYNPNLTNYHFDAYYPRRGSSLDKIKKMANTKTNPSQGDEPPTSNSYYNSKDPVKEVKTTFQRQVIIIKLIFGLTKMS